MCGSFAPRSTREVSYGSDSDDARRGVVLSNSHGRIVMGTKTDKLAEHVKKHSCLVELAYRPEQDMAVIRRNVEPLHEEMDR